MAICLTHASIRYVDEGVWCFTYSKGMVNTKLINGSDLVSFEIIMDLMYNAIDNNRVSACKGGNRNARNEY